jgi:hypothetical protein
MQKDRKAELEKQISVLRGELNRIKEAEADKAYSALVGKFFKAKNHYSCPEKPSDYWWIYVKVLGVSGGGLSCTSFQTDKNGEVNVRPDAFYMSVSLESYIEIPEKEYERAFCKMLSRLEAL